MNKTALTSTATVISSLSLVAVGVNPAIAQPTLDSLSAGITNPQPLPSLLALSSGIQSEPNSSPNSRPNFSQNSPATLVDAEGTSTTLVALADNTSWQPSGVNSAIAQPTLDSLNAGIPSPQPLPNLIALSSGIQTEPNSRQNSGPDFSQSPPTTLVALADNTSWKANAANLRDKLDQDSVFECAAGGQLETVWGSGVYSDESSVCSAAVHAGVISTERGGTVTIRTRPGQTAYAGSERNGVTTQESGIGQRSFVFLSSAMPTNEPIDWEYGVSDLRGRLDQSFTFTCMPNGVIHNVWGSDLYTDDSSVCSAAVHAGLINTREGGPVSIRMISGQGAYTSTSRNSVSTIGYGNWHGSFIFLR